jgi:hypothetical protein
MTINEIDTACYAWWPTTSQLPREYQDEQLQINAVLDQHRQKPGEVQ